jgi:hypothetical protein
VIELALNATGLANTNAPSVTTALIDFIILLSASVNRDTMMIAKIVSVPNVIEVAKHALMELHQSAKHAHRATTEPSTKTNVSAIQGSTMMVLMGHVLVHLFKLF